MRTYHKILGLVAALAIFAVGTAVTLAQSQDTNTPSVAETVQQEIVEAIQAARDEVIETAVTDGRLTTAQAERLQNWGESNRINQLARNAYMHMNQDQLQMGPMSGNCGCGLDTPIMDRTAMQTAMAEALGLSLEELEAALADGVRLPHLMAELGVDAEAVRAAMTEARETAVAQALADGTINQEQADCILNMTGRGPHVNSEYNRAHNMERQQQNYGQQNRDGQPNYGRMGPRGGNP
jgi:hypothetical protein